ncbi:MAG: exonuclease domain-containing protein [Patescibacteria group bacterium]
MFISLDLETTGFDSTKDKIIEFGAVKFNLDGSTETLQLLINPGIQIPQIITHITNITNDDLRDAPPFSDKAEEIQAFIGNDPIIGHNIKFDIGFLIANGIEIKNPSYDTQELATLLLFNIPSYSLEVLSDKLGLTHKEKHRALDDSIAAMELFWVLLEEFNKLEPELKQQIKTLSNKSNWDCKNLFQILPENYKSPVKYTLVPESAKKSITEATQALKDLQQKILTQEGNAIFEIDPSYLQLIKNLTAEIKKDYYIAVPYYDFREITPEIPDNIAKIDTAGSYLSLDRLQEFASKESYENTELTGLLKFLVFSKRTTTGLLSEVNLFGPEKNLVYQVNVDENNENFEGELFYKKALKKDELGPAICTHQFIIEEGINKPKKTDAKLIVFGLEKFMGTLHYKLSIGIKLESLTNLLNNLADLCPENESIKSLHSKSEILFGLIGILYSNNQDHGNSVARSTIDEFIIQKKDWLNVKDCVNNLIEISQGLGEIKNSKTIRLLKLWKQKLTELHQIFHITDFTNNFICIEEDYLGGLLVRQIPSTINETIQRILSNYSQYILIDEDLDIMDEGKFIKHLYGLGDLPIIKTEAKLNDLTVFTAETVDEVNRYYLTDLVAKYYNNHDENLVVIFSSKLQLDFFTMELSKQKIPIISQMAGSLGKLKEKISQQNDIKNILLITSNTWWKLDDHQKFDTVFIHKLPFEPPSDANLVALSRNFEDAFNELQIPKAVFCLKKIIKRMANSGRNKKVILLDDRINTKGYGKAFRENLEAMCPTESIDLNNL